MDNELPGYIETTEQYLEPVYYTFDIFIEYTLYSQKIVDGYIRDRNINHAFSLLSLIPHTVRTLIFKYYFYTRKQNEVERLSFIGNLAFPTHMTMQEVKKMICDRFGSKVPRPSNRMRIQHISSKQVFYDDQTLVANCDRIRNISVQQEQYDYSTLRVQIRHDLKMQLCCQQLDSVEIFTHKQILLRCFKCFVVESVGCLVQWKLDEDDFVQIVFIRDDHVDNIKTEIFEQIALCTHPNDLWFTIQKRNYFEKDSFVKELPAINELPVIQEYPLVGNYNDGDILVFIEKQDIYHSLPSVGSDRVYADVVEYEEQKQEEHTMDTIRVEHEEPTNCNCQIL